MLISDKTKFKVYLITFWSFFVRMEGWNLDILLSNDYRGVFVMVIDDKTIFYWLVEYVIGFISICFILIVLIFL